jgi:hypothetical protein
MKIRYINRKGDGCLETVDEFPANTREERAELKRCLVEYRLSDPSGFFYISSRSTKDWRQK